MKDDGGGPRPTLSRTTFLVTAGLILVLGGVLVAVMVPSLLRARVSVPYSRPVGVQAWPAPPLPPATAAPAFGIAEEAKRKIAAEHESGPERERDFNTEAYSHIVENAFLEARSNPLSTFAVDVDRASYANVRRFLREGSLPPPDAVRIEELVNYFAYAYPDPEGEEPFSVTTEVAECPWKRGHRLVLVGLQGRRIAERDLPPRNLTFLIDVSGSMNDPRKLPLVQRSLALLVERLREEDRVAIVVYAGAAGLVLAPTSGADKVAIREALGRLEAGGSTAGGAGIQLAYRVAAESFMEGGVNRVVLATDGDFNVGVSSEGELVRLIEEKRKTGIALSVLGYGMGNYKDSNLEKLADHGDGNYAYIDSLGEARKVLVKEAGGTLVTIARDVKVQVEFNPSRVAAYRLLGYENRLMRAEDFDDDAKDGGEIGAGHSVTALYEVVPAGGRSPARPAGALRYQGAAPPTTAAATSDELLTVKLRYKEPEGGASRLTSVAVREGERGEPSANLRMASAVAGFGLLLRRSEHRGTLDYAALLGLASEAVGGTGDAEREELLSLIRRAGELAPPLERPRKVTRSGDSPAS